MKEPDSSVIRERLNVGHKMAELALSKSGVREYRKIATVLAVVLEDYISIETREGYLNADKGDYLVCNKADPSYPWPVKKEIFEKTYRLVEWEKHSK